MPVMKQSKTLRLVSLAFAVGGFCLWVVQVYIGMTIPILPYQPKNPTQRVGEILDPQRAGSLQPGDQILTFNNTPICIYLIDSPLYSAPRNVPLPVTYRPFGTHTQVNTNIVLTNPSFQEMLSRSPDYFMAFVFVAVGIIILVGGIVDISHLLLGLTWLSAGFMYAGWKNYVESPLLIAPSWGVAITAILLVISHAVWPVNQLRRPAVRIIILVVGLIGLAHMLSVLPDSAWFGCYKSVTISTIMESIADWSYSGLILGYLATVYLMISAYRQTDNAFSRLQIRTITWAMGLGFGAPVLFYLAQIPWGPLGDLTQFISGIVPLTYLFVLYRGQLLAIDRYLNRLVFTCLFVIFWVIVTLTLAKWILFWQPQLDPVMLAVMIALLSLLAATFVCERLGMLVDLALYGAYYDYETVVSRLGQSLAGAQNEARFSQVVVQQLPQALSIRQAALWLAETDGQLRLVERSSGDPARPPLPALPPAAFPPGSAEVEVYNLPFHVGSDPTAWQTILRLYADTRLVGVVLLGVKYRENTYTERDVRTLQTLAGWIATTASNLAHLAEQERSMERERRLMLALAENEERLTMGVARELHDRGISALGMVRLMVEQERGRAIVAAGLEQVIANLRELSDNQLSPQGLSQGLSQALEAMLETQRQLALPVFLEVDPSYADGEPLSALVSRELFYIAQEAVVNALKHASPNRVRISLARPHGQVQLRIHNDGRAFDVAPTLTGREAHGMGIMQARANRIGGRLMITSTPDSGTEVKVSLDPASP